MTGLILLFIAAAWVSMIVMLAYAITKRIQGIVVRSLAALLLILVLIPLPLMNEILGKLQFERLCKDYAVIHVDRAAAFGKTVYLAESADIEINDKWLRFVVKPWRYIDVTTGEAVVSYNTLMSEGGLFFRIFRISEGNEPLVFKGSCYPSELVDLQKIFQELNVKQIQRSKLTAKDRQ